MAGAILVLCSLVPYALQGAQPSSGYAMIPGVIFGLYASVIVSGNPHGGSTASLLIVASIVNFFFYAGICYAVLLLYQTCRKKL